MIPHDDQPRACGSAAQLRETLRRSRSNIPSRVFIVILAAAAMPAAAIDDRFRMDCAKVAPSIQLLQTGTSIFSTNDGVVSTFSTNDGVVSSASGLAPRRRQSSVASALAPRRGPGRLDASSAGSFTASYFSTCSSSIYVSSLITSKSAIFDQKLITSLSEILQNCIAYGGFEKIERGGDFRVQRSSCRDIHRLALHHEVLPFLHSGPIVLDEGGGTKSCIRPPLRSSCTSLPCMPS